MDLADAGITLVKMLVCYFSKSGNTERMAHAIAAGAKEEGADVDIMKVVDVEVDSLPDYDALLMGSPTYYGTMSAECKDLFDRSVKLHGQLRGRMGGAFTSSGGRAGGNETTIIDILKAWMIHGMLVSGSHRKDHYGPVAVRAPDEEALRSCHQYGQRLAEQTAMLRG